jgi:hypothetical protein
VLLGGGDGELQPGLHARGIGAHRKIDKLFQLGELDDVIPQAVDLLLRKAERKTAELDVLFARKVRDQRCPDAQQIRARGGVDGAVAGRRQAHQGPHQRGLAGTVGTDHTDGLVLIGNEGDALERVHFTDPAAAALEQRPASAFDGLAAGIDPVLDVQIINHHYRLPPVG